MVNYLVQPAPRGNGGAQEGAPTGECSHRSSLDAVADVPIWFRWKLEPNEKGALTKVPYCAHHEGQASHTKPRDWGTLTQALASLERWGGNGLGIVAAALNDQYVHACLDVDGCYPPDSDQRGEWVEPAAAILAGCYHERSFSLTGEHYHFRVRREVAAKRRWRINAKRQSAGGLKDHGFELAASLDGGYYLTCTRKGEGELRVIEEPELQALYDYINSFKLRPKKQHKAPTSVSSSREPDLHANTLAAIAALANDSRFVDRDDWIVIGLAVHDGTGGSAAGLRAWIAWTERLHADAENACSRAWATFTEGGGTTVATLFMFAREDGWLDPRQPRTRTDYAPLSNDEAEPEGGEAKSNGAAIENAADVEAAQQVEKSRLLVDAANPDVTVTALRDILRNSGGLYDRGVPVRLAFDPAQRGLVAQVLTPDGVVMLAHSVSRPYRVKKADGTEIKVDTRLPKDIASMYLDWKGEWKLPVLNGISSTPMLKDDGTIVATAGYDKTSGMWCEDQPALGSLVPEAPTKDEAAASLALLRRTFRTFCFADAETVLDPDAGVAVVAQDRPIGHDESAMLNGALTAVCRPSLDQAPAFLLRGSRISGAGTGKGLAARCISLIAFGREPHAVTGGGSNEEIDKRIAAELMEGHPVLFLDNLNNATFKSDLLASVITERPARVRVLGLSKMVQLNSSAFVVLTGNGVSVAEDLARRVITTDLDAKTEDPETRPFKSNLREEVLAKRRELLAALLTIWRWGRRTTLQSGKPLGSFERWSRWVRDPLLALGCQDVVEQVSRAKARDPERQFVGELFEAWHDHHGSNPVAIRNLHEDVRQILDPQDRGRQFIQAKLRTLIGTRAAGFILTRQAAAGIWGAATYALLSAGDPIGHREHRGHRAEGSTQSPPEHEGANPMPPMPPMPLPGPDAKSADDPTRSASDEAEWETTI